MSIGGSIWFDLFDLVAERVFWRKRGEGVGKEIAEERTESRAAEGDYA